MGRSKKARRQHQSRYDIWHLPHTHQHVSGTTHCFSLTKTLSDGYNYPQFTNEELIGRRVADGDRWHDVVLQGFLGEEEKENQMEQELPKLVVGVVCRAAEAPQPDRQRLQTPTLEL